MSVLRLNNASYRLIGLLVVATIVAMMFLLAWLPKASAAPNAPWTIDVTSQETMWIDANKCNSQGPRGAWLSFWVTNTTGAVQDNVTVTFAGFSGPNASLFVPTDDPERQLGTVLVGEREAVYFYVDYSAVCGQSPLGGRTATYTLTVAGSSVTTVLGPRTITTDTLLTATAAGVVDSNVLGPGVWLGQLLEQTVVYRFNNNTDLFFQPAAEATFRDDCLRLANVEIVSFSPNVTGLGSPGDLDNRLHFPNGDVSPAGGDGLITVRYFWEVLCLNTTQNASPWAAAKSGQKYKYTQIGAAVTVPGAQPSLTAEKTGDRCLVPSNPSHTFTVTFTNITGQPNVPVYLKRIEDRFRLSDANGALASCVKITNASATGSEVTIGPSGNSSSWPSTSPTPASSPFIWDSKYNGFTSGGNKNIKGWKIDSSGDTTLELKFTVDFSACSTALNTRYANIAQGFMGSNPPGEVTVDADPFYIYYPCTTLSVTLADFYAEQVDDYVQVTWETVSELNNRGFNLYRATTAAGPYTRLNTALIPSQSQGSPSGFTYTWQDRDGLAAGVDYYYLLEDVDLSGAATSHGPVSVSYVGPTAVGLGAVQALPAAAAGLPLAGTLLALAAGLAGGLAMRRRA